jgi:hypothetical protein
MQGSEIGSRRVDLWHQVQDSETITGSLPLALATRVLRLFGGATDWQCYLRR